MQVAFPINKQQEPRHELQSRNLIYWKHACKIGFGPYWKGPYGVLTTKRIGDKTQITESTFLKSDNLSCFYSEHIHWSFLMILQKRTTLYSKEFFRKPRSSIKLSELDSIQPRCLGKNPQIPWAAECHMSLIFFPFLF